MSGGGSFIRVPEWAETAQFLRSEMNTPIKLICRAVGATYDQVKYWSRDETYREKKRQRSVEWNHLHKGKSNGTDTA